LPDDSLWKSLGSVHFDIWDYRTHKRNSVAEKSVFREAIIMT